MSAIHRVVTGHDEKGRSRILFDDSGSNNIVIESWPGGLKVSELWVTGESPANLDSDEDRALRPFSLNPVGGGTMFRRIEFPPKTGIRQEDAGAIWGDLGSESKPTDEMVEQHFSMHRTDSIDYLVILSGEIRMVMDEGEVLLKPGSCVVQQGTNHEWINEGTEPCVLVGIMVAANRPSAVA